jgi:hypothetical protein
MFFGMSSVLSSIHAHLHFRAGMEEKDRRKNLALHGRVNTHASSDKQWAIKNGFNDNITGLTQSGGYDHRGTRLRGP